MLSVNGYENLVFTPPVPPPPAGGGGGISAGSISVPADPGRGHAKRSSVELTSFPTLAQEPALHSVTTTINFVFEWNLLVVGIVCISCQFMSIGFCAW